MQKSKFYILSATSVIPFLQPCYVHGANESGCPQKDRLNVVFILADDLGWSDVSLYGSTQLYETPNLERLAERGIIMNSAYSASPLSSPTRASILTGQTPVRTGITSPCCNEAEVRMCALPGQKGTPDRKTADNISATRLDNTLPTLGKLFKNAGYTTGHFGKWHLGHEPYSPLEHGFDIDIPHWDGFGPPGSYIAPWPRAEFNMVPRYEGEHIEDRMAYEAVSWLRSIDLSKPFFMNYWMFSVHTPVGAKKEYVDEFRQKIDLKSSQKSPTYAAMVKSMDDAVGALLDEIDRLGIADNTLIVFFSDNGPATFTGLREKTVQDSIYITAPTSADPLRGGKCNVYEGGIRVPCVIVWPGVIEPASCSDDRMQSTDFYPTLLAAAGIDLPEGHEIDGVDIKNILTGGHSDRKPMFTYFPHNFKEGDWLPPCIAVHAGDWKLIRIFYMGEGIKHDYRLFNLKEDPYEKNDLSRKYLDKVRELDYLIEEYLIETKAVTPALNPNYDPMKFDPSTIGIQPGGLKVPPEQKPI